ncbi:hypothetical protein HYH39_17860 [Clostridium botulinum]|uniref:hypothetical protein n=1 Tax=Clostridium botulinum TaxID=1491 RepID=UPI000500C4D9|nr:hypothetical protein [Clostridium botulinum]KFX54734.1 hypothetical protein KU40_13305 [Clostridium botulinum]MBN1072726.1 hypothetical protein [Clostridium botulinum]MBY6780795.1 hypothetical protein [Clostridium botulinum]MBY6853968.1 hypothetical protein [Clostridium botulinum]
MYTVEEASKQLKVSKVTIYSKLKKFDTMVVLKQGKKYITDDLFKLIQDDLKVRNADNNNLNLNNNINLNDEIAMDTEDLINLNKDLVNTLMEQLREKDRQISELHKLIENNQVLLKQEKEVNQIQLEEHIRELDIKLNDVKENMDKRKEEQQEKRKGLLKKCMFWVG